MHTTTPFDGVTWKKSTFSSSDGNCVEVALTSTLVGVRDSKGPDTGRISVSIASWHRFLTAVK